MTPDQRIDANIKAVLQAGEFWGRYMSADAVENMREAMRRIMADSYIKGSNAHHDAMVVSGKLKK